MSVILALLACKGDPVATADLTGAGQRVQPAEVTFNLWTDYVPLLAALDGECRWMQPATVDDTTPWPPLQAFWVIHDNEADVTDPTIPDTYFEGDGLVPADFPAREGLDALGFKAFTGFQRSLLDVQDLRIDEDGRRIEADFGPPVNATVRLVAFDEPGCPFESHVCPEGCADFQPLTRIHLDLGTFYAVQDVRFY